MFDWVLNATLKLVNLADANTTYTESKQINNLILTARI